ncbi:unnamed protein product [Larinioides sclopetarius]|uniref:Uncharacterized protein n=1 Tax=Larinioides sclopetarius TaxID=280406 RepID=A0AAV2B2E0_9ARAC
MLMRELLTIDDKLNVHQIDVTSVFFLVSGFEPGILIFSIKPPSKRKLQISSKLTGRAHTQTQNFFGALRIHIDVQISHRHLQCTCGFSSECHVAHFGT